jgi:hypothetical protein
MTPRRCRPAPAVSSSAFKGFRFPPEIIVLAVRWYLRYGLSYRDLEELLAERGVEVDSEKRLTEHDHGADSRDRGRDFTPPPSFLPGILQPPPSSGARETGLTRRDASPGGTDSPDLGT